MEPECARANGLPKLRSAAELVGCIACCRHAAFAVHGNCWPTDYRLGQALPACMFVRLGLPVPVLVAADSQGGVH
jgi:hypothetical protein